MGSGVGVSSFWEAISGYRPDPVWGIIPQTPSSFRGSYSLLNTKTAGLRRLFGVSRPQIAFGSTRAPAHVRMKASMRGMKPVRQSTESSAPISLCLSPDSSSASANLAISSSLSPASAPSYIVSCAAASPLCAGSAVASGSFSGSAVSSGTAVSSGIAVAAGAGSPAPLRLVTTIKPIHSNQARPPARRPRFSSSAASDSPFLIPFSMGPTALLIRSAFSFTDFPVRSGRSRRLCGGIPSLPCPFQCC